MGPNVVPVNARTGLTEPVAVVPGSQQGTYVLAQDHSRRVYVAVRTQGSRHVIPAQRPTGAVTHVDGRLVTTLHGTLLGSAYYQDPVMGIVAALPDRLGWLRDLLRPWIALLAAVHPHRGDERRSHGFVARRLCHGDTTARCLRCWGGCTPGG